MKFNEKKICIVIPHKGVGDIIFHNFFIKSISKFYNKKITIFVNFSTKANHIYKNNSYIEKIVFMDLKRPKKIFYIFKIIKIIFEISKNDISELYYTGNSKWHKLSFKIASIIKGFNFKYIRKRKKLIIQHLVDFLKQISVKRINSYIPESNIKISKKFRKKLRNLKKPWIFLSIDTSENQITIPNTLLVKILDKLKKKNVQIFVNTNKSNSFKTKFLKDKRIIKTDNLNISEISYIIKNSKLFIGNESGPAVIASLFCKKNIIFLNSNVLPETSMMPFKNNRKYFKITNYNKNSRAILNII